MISKKNVRPIDLKKDGSPYKTPDYQRRAKKNYHNKVKMWRESVKVLRNLPLGDDLFAV